MRDFPSAVDVPVQAPDLDATSDGASDQETSEFCPTCGAKTVEYPHSLTTGLVIGLAALQRAGGGPINLNKLGLNYSQQCNFQKLRYFDLVARVYVDGVHKNGFWEITEKGKCFLAGSVRVPSKVWTYRGSPVRFGDRQVHVREVVEDYMQRPEWAEVAVPREATGA